METVLYDAFGRPPIPNLAAGRVLRVDFDFRVRHPCGFQCAIFDFSPSPLVRSTSVQF